jgi:hypothetical protein
LDEEIRGCRRYDHELSLILFDVDGFPFKAGQKAELIADFLYYFACKMNLQKPKKYERPV